jgi:hypothetical protein
LGSATGVTAASETARTSLWLMPKSWRKARLKPDGSAKRSSSGDCGGITLTRE